MPETLFPPATRIRGFRPGLDVKQLPEVSVLNGQNFLLDAKGPFSTFGSVGVTGCAVRQAEYLESYKIDTFMIIMYLGLAFKYDANAAILYPVFSFTDNGDLFPWSHAAVGTEHYFCRKGVGVIRFDPVVNEWEVLTHASLPSGPVGVAESGGRLIIQGTDRVSYSAIGDGTDLTPSVSTGAGFQLLVEHTGGGDPLGVFAVDDGFISFTKRGIMKSEVISGAAAFRHYNLTKEQAVVPLSQYAIVDLQESGGIVFLGKGGFFATRGERPAAWQPLMSEFFRQILGQFDLSNPSLINLSHSEDKQWFFVSLAENEQPFLYPISYVMYIPLEEWGIFNRVHKSLGQYNFADIDQGFNFGYSDFNGNLRRFVDDALVQATPDLNTDYCYNEIPTIDAHYEVISSVQTAVFPTMAIFDIYPPEDFTEGAGVYTFTAGREFNSPADFPAIDESSQNGATNIFECDLQMAAGIKLWEVRKTVLDNESIDSYIDVGLFRFSESQAPDEFSILVKVATHTEQLAVGGEQEDWLTFSPETTEDWATFSPETAEDWGEGIGGVADFDVDAIGTLDGEDQWEDQLEALTIATQDGGTRQYAAYNAGVYSFVKIKALNQNQNFHLHSLEVSGIMGGRL